MKTLIQTLLRRIVSALRDRWYLQLENVALRHQLEVLKRSAQRPRFEPADRFLWLILSRWWSQWPQALQIMQADTVRRWRRQGIWHHLRWRRGRRRPGRPPIPVETRHLIREISRDNVLWGAPRIHGELAKLGLNVSRTTVAKYMTRRRYPPSPTWRAFLCNQTPAFCRAEVSAELAEQFRAAFMPCWQLLRRWYRWLCFPRQSQCGRGHEISYTTRSDFVSVLTTWAFGRANQVRVSGRSPPGSHQSSTTPIRDAHADGSSEIGMADVRPHSSVRHGGTVPLPLSNTPQSENKEQSTEGAQHAAA